MPHDIDEPRAPGHPVIKRQAIGERFVGALVAQHQRPVQKRVNGVSTTVYKADGKPRQELVLTLITMPGTTSTAGLGDTTAVPNPGDTVRLILRGGGFAAWLDAKKALGRGLKTGDVVTELAEWAQVYDADGNPTGNKLTEQAAVDAALRARKTVGIYGPISVRPPTTAEQEWVNAADAAYHIAKAKPPTALEDAPDPQYI